MLVALPEGDVPKTVAPIEPSTAVAKINLPTEPPKVEEAPALAVSDDCKIDLGLSAGTQAMISVTLTAPCRAGERVVLRHAGLAIAEVVAKDGTLILDLPALSAEGEVSVLFPDAETAVGKVAIPDLASVKRFGVQWMADDAFQLHILEAGADYGQPGDVWTDAPVSPNGGYLVALGNPELTLPMMANVYTWPADSSIAADVMLEAEVTEKTCGRELLGEALALEAGSVDITELTLAMPGCDALGDILVLKNPGQDVTLSASN
ncbi:MAG: hypothetical protein ACKO2N_13605 [Tabrizicola sp.]